MNQKFNTRILVIDDDETVRDSFRQILAPCESIENASSDLQAAESKLFGGGVLSFGARNRKRSSATFEFEYDDAANGQLGLKKVEKALQEERPYAAIFVDMRMPGWDGLETVNHIRSIDKRVEIIFVTAFSDHSIEEIVSDVGANVSYHCKPFSVEEIGQIATKAVYEWNKAVSLENLIRTVSHLRAQNWQLEPLLQNILKQVAYLLGTHSALLAVKRNGIFEKVLSIGHLSDNSVSDGYLATLPQQVAEEVYQTDDYAYFTVEKYGVLAIFEVTGKPLNSERIYIVRLFLEQAAQAIQNVGLQEELIRSEKLSAVGMSTSMITHDLRNSLSTIELAIEMILEDLDDKEFVRKMLDSINEASTDAVAFANDILDYVSNVGVNKAPVHISEIIDTVEHKCELAKQKYNFVLEIDCKEDVVFDADEGKLFRVLLNLVKNAAEALNEKQIANPTIKISTNVNDKSVEFFVGDNGPGIPDEILDSLFKPFVTEGKMQGTGLGLAIVKQIVTSHGGSISMDSTANGTVFKIELPR